jgi:ATP synthase F1 delta subunit
MEALSIGTTYGTALFEAACDRDKTELINEELLALEGVFDSEPQFYALLCSPGLGAGSKKAMITEIFKGKLSEELVNFLYVLIDKRRVGQCHVIAKAYRKLHNEKLGVSKGTIYSAVPLEGDRLERMEKETGRLLRKNVKLENRVDGKLIGGVRIYIEGKLIDASIRTRLDSMKEQMI